MSNYPKTVRIGYADYEIKFIPPGIRDEASAIFCPQDQRISVCDANAPAYIARCVLHEVLHGCFYHSALCESPVEEFEELIVDAMSKSMLDVMRQNPKLIEALMSDMK